MAERQQQSIEEMFEAVLDLPPAERQDFLNQACRGAPELRMLVEELLAEDQRAGSFLACSPLDRAGLTSQACTQTSTLSADYTRRGLAERASRFQPTELIAGRFIVIRFLARGGMGEVYEVEDRLLQGTRVALKIIRPEIAADTGSSHRFEQEVLLARKVNHPNLCPIYEIFRCEEPTPAFLFLTMKLLHGETLRTRLQRSKVISREEASQIGAELISGVAAIHAAGVIHRDIKPNNVMLERSRGGGVCVSIMDFGLARLHESEETLATGGAVAGTPGYLAPELLQGSQPTQATDLFALGVVLHEVLAGERPVVSRDGLTVSCSTALSRVDASAELVRAVRDFLAKDPQRRCAGFERLRSRGSLATTGAVEMMERSPLLSRRAFVWTAGVSACSLAGAAAWKHDAIYDLMHPLPRKRFVALVDWPPGPDSQTRPMVMGLIDAMADELARAEAFDPNFYVAPQRTTARLTTPAELNEVRESLGANLLLATSGKTEKDEVHIAMHVMDPVSSRTLRSKELRSPLGDQLSLPQRVVRAAAELLDVARYDPDDRRSRAGTENPEAFAAFQEAEALFRQANRAGVEEAIGKYKVAVDLDRHFAEAHAGLSRAYMQLYAKHGDPATITLARANADTALALDSKSAQGHVALACVFWGAGALEDALHEIGVALSIDPSDTSTMTYQAQIYSALDRWMEAEAVYKRVLRLRPNYWLAYNELGNNYNAMANYVDALGAYRAASAIAPNQALPLNNIASMYFQLGEFDEALRTIDQSLKIAPDSGAYLTRSDVLRTQGRALEALNAALEGAKLSPEDGESWLKVGDAASLVPDHAKEAAEAYKKAAEMQQRRLDAESGDGQGWMFLALSRMKSGRPETALSLVKKAETLGAADMDSQLIKVRVLELLGLRAEAVNLAKALMKKGVTQAQLSSVQDLNSLRKTLLEQHSSVSLPANFSAKDGRS